MSRIIVCYQDGDGETLTRRLIDSLHESFGKRTVLDIQDGKSFGGFRSGDVLVVVMGRTWVKSAEQADTRGSGIWGTISSALLNSSVFVIPVLLNNTPAPRLGNLPLGLQKLSQHEIMPCRDELYGDDTRRIIHAIRVRNAGRRSYRWLAFLAGALVLLLIIGGIFLFYRTETFKTIAADFDATLERIDPARVDVYREQGWANYGAGDYTTAIQYFERILSLQINDLDAYNGLAQSYFGMKEYDKAELNYNKMVEMAPTLTFIYMERGRFYQAIGNAEAAIPDFERVTEKIPLSEEAFMGLAQSYEKVGEYRKAVDTYQHLITFIDGRSATAFYGMGKSNDALKRYKQALDAFQHYLELEPNDPDPAILQRVEELKVLVNPQS